MGKRSEKSPEDQKYGPSKRKRMAEICQKYSMFKGTQSDFAEAEGVSRRLVNESIQWGKGNNILVTNFIEERLDPEIRKHFDQSGNSQHLKEELMPFLRERGVKICEVFPSFKVKKPNNFDHQLIEFARNSSESLISVIRGSKQVGIGWGATLSHIVDQMEKKLIENGSLLNAVQFVPLAGNQFSGTVEGLSSSLAYKLNLITKAAAQSYLFGIPAILPLSLNKKERDTFRSFFQNSRDYKAIFTGYGSEPPLTQKMGCFLSSIGTPEQPWKVFWGGIFPMLQEEKAQQEMQKVACGVIAGVPIPKEKFSKSPHLRKYLDSWMGVPLDVIRNLAESARRRKDQPGVVLAVVGGHKKDALLHILERRLCNVLFIDHELAHLLLHCFQKEGA